MEPKGVALILKDSEGKYLLHLRDGNTNRMPNQWALIGGWIDGDETPLHAVVREAFEELNLDVKNVREFKTVDATEMIGGSMVIFSGDLDVSLDTLPVNEGVELKFFTVPELKLLIDSVIYSNIHLEALKEYANI